MINNSNKLLDSILQNTSCIFWSWNNLFNNVLLINKIAFYEQLLQYEI